MGIVAAYIDQIIMCLVGAWATGVGYGLLPMPGKDEAAKAQWRSRFGKLLQVIGPLLIAIALILALAQGFKPAA